jgi:Uma2 family endonuclease
MRQTRPEPWHILMSPPPAPAHGKKQNSPEICVEILSPSNTAGEIDEKIALYFEAGAREVWICGRDGTLKFHFSSPPEIRESSELCPQFPPLISF